jgi:uncharacterized SAM-binding protein YcdF (DUF218 family)
MIFSSGFVYAFKEPDVMKALAVSLGVRPGDIILEKAAQSTYENVKFSMEIARRQGYRSLIFVSSPYHMRRLEMTAARLGGVYGYEKDDLVFSPIPYSLFYGDGKRVLPRHVRAILSEYMRIAYYKLKGYI